MSFKIFNGRNAFYQWDLNQKLIVDSNRQVHFKAPNERSCYVVNPRGENGEWVVDVPNILLRTTEKIVVWSYVDSNEKFTVETATFNVVPRQKPSDYVYTETEVHDYKRLSDRIDKLVRLGINDENVDSETSWSSARIIECFPDFTAKGTKGESVKCEPVSGSELNVEESVLLSTSSGSGSTAKLDHVDSLSLKVKSDGGEKTYTTEFPSGIHLRKGKYNWNSGELRETTILEVFDGSNDEVINKSPNANYPYGYVFTLNLNAIAATLNSAGSDKRDQSKCNRATYVVNLRANYERNTFSIDSDGKYMLYMPPSGAPTDVSLFRQWLEANPIHIEYIPVSPRITNVGGHVVRAGEGENTLSSTGSLTVNGKMNPSVPTPEQIGAMPEFSVGDGLTMADGVLSAVGGVTLSDMRKIAEITVEEETDALTVDLGKMCKMCRFVYHFPDKITGGYTYTLVSESGQDSDYYNMCGTDVANTKILEFIRIATDYRPITLFAKCAFEGNESNGRIDFCFPYQNAIRADEKNGFRYVKFTAYNFVFPVGTVITVLGA